MPIRAINPHAKSLRHDMTDAERALWHQLRDRRLGGLKFKRQWTLGPFVADFCCIERKLVIEVDGGQHAKSSSDERRTVALNRLGYRVIRFWNNDVLGNMEGVLTLISAELAQAVPPRPHPNPLPHAGEGA